MPLSATLCLSRASLSRHLSRRLLSGMRCCLVLLYLYLCAHLYTRCSSCLTLDFSWETTDVPFVRLSRGWRPPGCTWLIRPLLKAILELVVTPEALCVAAQPSSLLLCFCSLQGSCKKMLVHIIVPFYIFPMHFPFDNPHSIVGSFLIQLSKWGHPFLFLGSHVLDNILRGWLRLREITPMEPLERNQKVKLTVLLANWSQLQGE